MSQSSDNTTVKPKKTSLRQHKGIKYSKDLDSNQIWTVLNSLLFEAAAPLCVYADMSVETTLSCLFLSTNKRRSVSYDKPEILMTKLFYELAQIVEPVNNTDEFKLDLMEYLLNGGIERNIVVDHIVYSLQSNKLTEQKIDKSKLNKHVAAYLNDYKIFKQDVVFKFYYLINTFANRNHYVKSKSGLNSDKTGMFHVYMISAMKAIDRFIPYKGTLTSYMEIWFQNAEGSSDFMVYDGEAFSLNRNVRKSIQDGDKDINNKGIPIHDREDTLFDEDSLKEINIFPEFSRHISKLPNATLVFLAQALPYTLSKEQKERINQANNRRKQNV